MHIINDPDDQFGLFSRTSITSYLQQTMADGARAGASVAILLGDIDRFAGVNYHHGHVLGDELIRRIGKVIEERIGGAGMSGRYGGDEFIVVLPGVDLHTAEENAQQIVTEVRNLTLDGAPDHKFSITFAVCSYPSHGATVQELIYAAEEALATGKRTGRKCVVAD